MEDQNWLFVASEIVQKESTEGIEEVWEWLLVTLRYKWKVVQVLLDESGFVSLNSDEW